MMQSSDMIKDDNGNIVMKCGRCNGSGEVFDKTLYEITKNHYLGGLKCYDKCKKCSGKGYITIVP